MSKLYQVRHVTRFRYEDEISENVMEVRKCPITRENQRCMSFKIKVRPKAKLSKFEEHMGNVVHNFDIPQPHTQLTITAESLVEVKIPAELPDKGEMSMWDELKALEAKTAFLEFIFFSPLVEATESLKSLYEEVKPGESEDPLTFLLRVNTQIAEKLEYAPSSTQVDSSVDAALKEKRGVCQDFAHVMIGLVRLAGIPCRYVSGYLYHQPDGQDRSRSDAVHAWVEAYLPGLGWIGFDPTNAILAGDRHIATALGRDYKDVPPTRGVFRGFAAAELSVAVQVNPADATHADDDFRRMDESGFRSEPQEATAGQQQQ